MQRTQLLQRNMANRRLLQQPARNFSTKNSAFETYLLDRLACMQSVFGYGFAIWGLLNLGTFGLSQVMSKQSWDYHFAYTGNGKLLQPLKSMMASDSLSNVGWTSASLVLGGAYLQRRIGNLAATKLFGLSLLACYGATVCLGPATHIGMVHARKLMPMRWDCIETNPTRMVGADLLAGSLLYAILCIEGYFVVAVPFVAFDLLYYGPMGGVMPASGALFALTML